MLACVLAEVASTNVGGDGSTLAWLTGPDHHPPQPRIRFIAGSKSGSSATVAPWRLPKYATSTFAPSYESPGGSQA